eukprot:4670291-Prymnesium_polylepis.1
MGEARDAAAAHAGIDGAASPHEWDTRMLPQHQLAPRGCDPSDLLLPLGACILAALLWLCIKAWEAQEPSSVEAWEKPAATGAHTTLDLSSATIDACKRCGELLLSQPGDPVDTKH